MRVVVQRVKEARVEVEGKVVGQINHGLLLFLGIEEQDSEEDIQWLSRKIANLRIFSDEEGQMNRSVKDVGGELLLVSQFTLHASTKKGTRPSFIKAAKPQLAEPLYNKMKLVLANELNREISSGEFGANMEVSLINDGPVTILIDTKNKE